jgi:hypothetical protein
MQLTWQKLLIFMLVPFSDFIIRVFYMKGTIDHIWTLFPLFQIPPFTLIPLLLIKFGQIKNGKLITSPFDVFVGLFYFIRMLLRMSITCQSSSPFTKFMIDICGTVSAMLIPLLIRNFHPYKKTCGNNSTKNKNAFFKTIGQTGMLYSFMIFIMFVVPKFKPIVEYLGEDLVYLFLYIFGYIILNMYNENQLKKFCGFSTNSTYQLIAGLVSLVISGKILQNRRYGAFDRNTEGLIPE